MTETDEATPLVVALREGMLPANAPAATQLMLDLGAVTDRVSLELTNPDISYEDWEAVGKMVGLVGNAWQWWTGDWLIAGETLFGEESAQASDNIDSRFDLALQVTGREAGTLSNIRAVCAKVARDRRRAELTFAHHQEVAPLEPADQTKWLKAAIKNKWNRNQLRDAIRGSREPLPGMEGEGGGGGGTTVAERIERAARDLLNTAQPRDGERVAPEESWVRLEEAFGQR